MRLRAALTAGALIASLLAGTPPAEAARSDMGQIVLTKAKAERLAKAGVLTKNDLKTFRSEAAEAPDPDMVAAVYDCMGVKIPRYLAQNDGRNFEKRALLIQSSAYVVSTTKAAKADFRSAMSKKADRCIARSLRQSFEDEGAEVDSVRVRRFAVTVAGPDLAFGQRFVLTGSLGDLSFRVVGLNLNALVGHTQMAIGSTRYDGREPNLTQAESLLTTVVQRVRAL